LRNFHILIKSLVNSVRRSVSSKNVVVASHCLASISFIIASVGCQSPAIRLNAEQAKIRAQLRQIDPVSDHLARTTPIIDIHTHTFNARYLPLKGIVLGKRDAFPPVTWLISDGCAETLANALIQRTEIAPAAGMPVVKRNTRPRHDYHGPVCQVFLSLLDKAAAAGAWDKGISPREQMRRLDQVADSMNLQERMAMRAAAHMMGMEGRFKMADQPSAYRGLVRFLWLLTQNDLDLTRLFRLAYSDVPMQGDPLLVSHMIDLAPVYDQTADGGALLDFESQQLRRIENYQNRSGSGMIYFVAYNPYRDHWPTNEPGDGLRLVRSAVEEHGAWGVKVYPPSGYRPAGNRIKPRPTLVLTKFPGQQWDARYRGLGSDANGALNERLEKLLLWCIETDIPVFVHCGTGEFEARKGYGLYHSDPHFWRQFLEQHPSPDGSPCRLRLCLGHAGGEDFWFGGTKYSDWGKEVYDLCREFPNVYCEITTHANLIDLNNEAFLVDRLAKCFEESPQRDAAAGRFHYRFSKKLIYGTDWYLPDAAERRDILLATERAFLHPRLRAFYQDYFFDNALRYLNAKARLNDPRHPLPPAVQERIQHALRLSRK
jgi:predicted TIM-barrel fold metal-dependent hydrolase